MLPDVAPQEVTSRLVAVQGVRHPSFGGVEAQPNLGPPRLQCLLASVEGRQVAVEPHTVIRLSDDGGFWGDLVHRLSHAVQGEQSCQGGKNAPWGRPCQGWQETLAVPPPGPQPGFALTTKGGKGLGFGQERLVTDAIEALRDINLQPVLRPKLAAVKDRGHRIPTAAPRPEAIGMGGEFGFPFPATIA
jgi:hypothetical protein